MKIYEGIELENYKKNNLQIDETWNERSFVSCVKNYLRGSTEKILAIGGLRGTGKTVGILQAATGYDVAYILTQKGEEETGKDYIDFLQNTDKKYIIFDEYSWIKNRDELDRYLLTSVQNNKRIILTATESITLDFLNYGALNHRVQTLHTTMFTYEEYLKLYGKEHSKATCRQFLTEGGLFKEYALKNYEATRKYVEEALVKNLAAYLKEDMDEEMARALTYAVLYKAICPSNLNSIPTLQSSHVTVENFLDEWGVNTTIEPNSRDVKRVADIFEQTGIIVRIPNFNENSNIEEQYYITNPSLTCQLILSAYNINKIDSYILGHVFESVVAVQLATNKLEEHEIFFYNNETQATGNSNHELDVIITDREREFAYFFECKFSEKNEPRRDITLLSGYLESHEFTGTDIEGRYIVYTGKPEVKEYPVGPVVFTPIGDVLNRYFEFEENIEEIQSSKEEKNNAKETPQNFLQSAQKQAKLLKKKKGKEKKPRHKENLNR